MVHDRPHGEALRCRKGPLKAIASLKEVARQQQQQLWRSSATVNELVSGRSIVKRVRGKFYSKPSPLQQIADSFMVNIDNVQR